MFLFPEKKYLESLKIAIDWQDYFPDDEISLLKEKNRFHQIQSRVNCNFIKQSLFLLKVAIKPPFGMGEDHVQVAELVLPHVKQPLAAQIKDICEAIDDPFRCFFSLSMLCTYGINKPCSIVLTFLIGPRKEFVYQHASQNTNFNETFLVTGDDQKNKLINENDAPDAVLLQRAFAKHCNQLHYNGDSGLTPYKILALHVYITRLSPTFYNHEIEYSDDEDY